MFYIRADGNAAIGIGHIMRCLSIAEAVKETGAEEPVFLLADNICYNMVADRGFAAKSARNGLPAYAVRIRETVHNC